MRSDIRVTTMSMYVSIRMIQSSINFSVPPGGWSCTRVDEYSSSVLINDEGRRCWEAHNTLDCSTVVFLFLFLLPVQYVFCGILP